MSMLHWAALAELERGDCRDAFDPRACQYPLLDPEGIDSECLRIFFTCGEQRVERLYGWIQQHVLDSIQAEVLEQGWRLVGDFSKHLTEGMMKFNEAKKVT